jgi:protein TonB
MSSRTIIYGASFLFHAALGVWIGKMDSRTRGENIAISVSEAEAKKNEDKPKPPPDPPRLETKEPEAKRKAARAEQKAKVAPPTPTDAPPPGPANAAMDALPDFGLTLSGGVGPGGIAVPTGNAAAAPTEKKVQVDKPPPRVLAPALTDACAEPLVKPKPIRVPQPAYTEAARSANIEGRVRVEVSVDAEGRVTGVRILSGLGHGLDEAALASARQASFSPATRCGKPVSTTFVIAMRFSL